MGGEDGSCRLAKQKRGVTQTDVVKPETWNSMDSLIRGHDKVHRHYESDALAERRPVVIAPY